MHFRTATFKPAHNKFAEKIEPNTLSLEEFLNGLSQLLLQYGYFGVFLLSFIGTASIIVPVPYTLIIFTLSAPPFSWDPILLIIAGGVGSAIGELSGYVLGYFGRKIVSKERQRKMTYLVKLIDRYGPLAIFTFALTPLPDDVLFIPLGILRYKLYKAFIPALIGKVLMISILVYFGGLWGNILLQVFGDSGNLYAMLATAILLVVVLIALYRIDWEEVFRKHFGERGAKES